MNAQQCGTDAIVENQYYSRSTSSNYTPTTYNLCINIAFRIFRDNDGSNGYDVSKLPLILNNLNQLFNPHGIIIYQAGTYDYINNTNYNNNLSAISIPQIPNAINIYVVTNYSSPGEAFAGSNTTTRAIVKKSALLNIDNTLAHEIGHCLNLRHTHQSSYNNFSPAPCFGFDAALAENPNGFEAKTHGDFVEDTPADKYITPNSCISTTLNWNLSLYNPNKNNIMSYWLNAKDHFTYGQGERMQDAIENAVYLQPFRSYQCSEISGKSKLCINQINTYGLTNASFGSPTYSWSVTGNLQILGSTTNSTINVSRLASTSTISGLISVLINNTITKTKAVRNRCGFLGLLGKYDWVSKNYGNMGLIAPIDPEDVDDDAIRSYVWEIKENVNANVTNIEGNKPFFVGAATNEPLKLTSATKQAVVNWGSCSSSYLLSCYGITVSGEEFLISESYVDVGDPKNNPCFKDAITTTVAPNPIRDGRINVILIKPTQTSPCNYKDLNQPQYFNSEIDEINNAVSIFDYNGTEIYRKIFETNEFIIDDANLQSGNNYIINLYTKEGGFTQKVIVVE